MATLTVTDSTGAQTPFENDERKAIDAATKIAKSNPSKRVHIVGTAQDGTAINLSLTYSSTQGILAVDNLA